MSEQGGPTIAEMQPKSSGIVGKVKETLYKTLTVEGRADDLAQKHVDQVLANVSEADRAKAMEIMEQKRPDLAQAYMSQAQGDLLRDAVVVGTGAVVLVGGAYGLSRIPSVQRAVSGMTERVVGTGVGQSALSLARKGQEKVKGVMDWVLGKHAKTESKQVKDYLAYIQKRQKEFENLGARVVAPTWSERAGIIKEMNQAARVNKLRTIGRRHIPVISKVDRLTFLNQQKKNEVARKAFDRLVKRSLKKK